jgi:trehalose-6-phosphate synthase
MAYYDRVNTELKQKLYAQLVIENHPIYGSSPFKEAILERPADFNLEHLVEQMMAANSGGLYEFNDGIHEDFTDESECKTGTLHTNGSMASAEITNVRSQDGVLKRGAIRAVILNPMLEKLHFLFIPKEAVQKCMHTRKGTPTVSRSLWLRYNKVKKQFTTLEKYGIIEHSNFRDLAMEKNV